MIMQKFYKDVYRPMFFLMFACYQMRVSRCQWPLEKISFKDGKILNTGANFP